MQVEFPHNSVSARLKIEMPDCTDKSDIAEEDLDTVSLAVHIHDPAPDGVKLSRKNICFIDIEPENSSEDLQKKDEHDKMVNYFIANKDITWA